MKKISTIKRIFSLSLALAMSISTLGSLQSCGTDGVEVIPKPIPVEHTVKLKLTGTNAVVTKAVVMIGANTTEYGSLSGSTWESADLKVAHSEGTIALSAYGTGSGTASVLKAEIFVDGKLVKSGTASGTTPNATVFYTFP